MNLTANDFLKQLELVLKATKMMSESGFGINEQSEILKRVEQINNTPSISTTPVQSNDQPVQSNVQPIKQNDQPISIPIPIPKNTNTLTAQETIQILSYEPGTKIKKQPKTKQTKGDKPTKDSNTVYRCPHCSKELLTMKKMKKHMNEKHENEAKFDIVLEVGKNEGQRKKIKGNTKDTNKQ